MRGKASLKLLVRQLQRITPAYAGKSAGVANTPFEIKDHPRLCGEKSTKSNCPLMQMGSPPPMRGKVSAAGDVTGVKRITPAYAGKRQDFAMHV